MLKIQDLSMSYPIVSGRLQVLKDINLEVNEGDFLMIMGESGSGKTTLLNTISTLLSPDSGSIKMSDKDVLKLKGKDLESFRLHDIAFVFQENYMVEGLTILENIMVSRLQYDAKAEEKALVLLEKLNILDIKDKYPHQVSGGEKQRASIARALINEPKVLFADEPTASLNPKTANVLLESLKVLNQEGHTIIMVTHSISAATFGTRLLVLSDLGIAIDTEIPKDNAHDFIMQKVAPYL